MITKLPRWVEYGAFVLAFIAGCINAVGLLGFQHEAISHLSGTATLLGSGMINSSLADTLHLLGVLLSFLIGASVSGFFLSGRSLKPGRHYDTLLAIEGLLLLGSIVLLESTSLTGHYLASAACGLQNALVTTYSGAIVRTTHLTGIFTDLGIMIGGRARGETLDKRKAMLLLIIIVGFIVGGVFGAYIFAQIHFYALIVPAVVCFILAVSYRVFVFNQHH